MAEDRKDGGDVAKEIAAETAKAGAVGASAFIGCPLMAATLAGTLYLGDEGSPPSK